MAFLEFISNTIIAIYLPVAWVLLFVGATRTKHYSTLIFTSVLVHTAYLLLIQVWGLLFIGRGLFVVDSHSGIAIIIVSLVILALIGIAISTLSVLLATKHWFWILSIIIAISAIALSPLLDDIGHKPVPYVTSLLQGTETETHEYKIYLGSSYIYRELNTETGMPLLIHKLRPGFEGIDFDYSLTVETGKKEEIERLIDACQNEEITCKTYSQQSYQAISIFIAGDGVYHGNQTLSYYYNFKCDAYLETSNDISDGKYTDFVERFFSDNCS